MIAVFDDRAATTVTWELDGIAAGAVYTPLAEMDPPPTTLQFTPVWAEPVIVSVKFTVLPREATGLVAARLGAAMATVGVATDSLKDAVVPTPGFCT